MQYNLFNMKTMATSCDKDARLDNLTINPQEVYLPLEEDKTNDMLMNIKFVCVAAMVI